MIQPLAIDDEKELRRVFEILDMSYEFKNDILIYIYNKKIPL